MNPDIEVIIDIKLDIDVFIYYDLVDSGNGSPRRFYLPSSQYFDTGIIYYIYFRL